jgi:hypothetical protein
MAQVLQGTATTTHAIREKIQNVEESISQSRYNINPKTAHKWKHRESVEDLKCGRWPAQVSVLSGVDEAVIVEARRKALLPLDDLYDLLLPHIPAPTCTVACNATASAILPTLLPDDGKAMTKAFKTYEPGFLHIDSA